MLRDRMKRGLGFALALGGLTAVLLPVESGAQAVRKTPPPSSQQKWQMPQMHAAVAQFLDRIDKATTLTWSVQSWAQDDLDMHGGAPGKSVFYVKNAFEVKAQRPNLVSIVRTPAVSQTEITRYGQTRTMFDNYGDDVYHCDGRQSLFLDSYLHTYRTGKAPESLFATKRSAGANDPMSFFHGALEWFFDERFLAGYTRSTDERLPTANCAVYLLEDPREKPVQREKIYFDLKTGEMLRISDLDKDAKGKWTERSRTEFRFWDFDPPLPYYTFDTHVPRTYRTSEALKREIDEKRKNQKSVDSNFHSHGADKAPEPLSAMKRSKGGDGRMVWLTEAKDRFFGYHPIDENKPSTFADDISASYGDYLRELIEHYGLRIVFEKGGPSIWVPYESRLTRFRFWNPQPSYMFDTRLPRNYRAQ